MSPKAQMPPLSCSPPPASGGHGAAGGGISPSHAQRPPHSSPEGSGRPHLSGERSLPTQPLSCPYTHGWGGSSLSSWGPSTQIQAGGAGQGGRHRGHHCGPSSDLGWGTQGGGLPGLRSDGGSPCEARVWGLPLTPSRPGSRQGLQEDSSKVWKQVRGHGQQSCASSPGLRPERGWGHGRRGSSRPETSDAPPSPAQGRRPLGARAGEPRERVTRRAAPTPAPPSGSESGGRRGPAAASRPPFDHPTCSLTAPTPGLWSLLLLTLPRNKGAIV